MSSTEIKRKRSRQKKSLEVTNIPDDEELKHLEKIVLGGGTDVFEDTASEEDSDEEISPKKEKLEEKKPAWVDDDDKGTFNEIVEKQGRRITPGVSGSKDYQVIVKEKYQQIMGVPKWSKFRKRESSVDDLLNTCGSFIRKPKFLAKDELEFKKLKYLNYETRNEGPFINVVKFHPKSTVAMVGGVSGIVSLFQVDGKQNTKLQSLHFKNYPVYCGSFLKNGEEFLIGSRFHKFFYCHNLMTGKTIEINHSKLINITHTKQFCVSPNDELIAVCGDTGKIFLLTTSSKEILGSLQMNCNVTALDFSQDGSFLYSHGEDGEVYIWDMKSRACIRKFYDDGCLIGSSIAISGNDQFMACGSSSGVVNIYDLESVQAGTLSLPTKSIFNLVTPVTGVLFNKSSEVLAIASNKKEKAIKLVHCPSMTVFSNFPHFKNTIVRPFSMDFSPNSGYFAVGDSKGSAHLFRLKYFGNY